MSLEGRSIGNYVVRKLLGEGGMGAVYLGEHPLIGKKVAVKVLKESLASDAEIVRRFFNEARAVNDIRHENIVDIVDFGKMPTDTGGQIAYIIMEFLDGESLAARLHSVGLRVPEVIEVMLQCCSALSASHQKGIIHRDLKPENIYLCPRGPTRNFVKVLDFGIAKLTGGDGDHAQTRTGAVMGTPYYMSPEQCEGRKHIDHRSDIYSLGVVMYELLTGRVPFTGEGFGAIIVAHMTQPVPPPRSVRPGIPPELEAVVLQAMEKDPNYRFQTMDEFAQALGDPAWFGSLQPMRASAQMATIAPGSDGRLPSQPPRSPSYPRFGSSGVRPSTTLSGAASEVSQPIPLVSGGRSRAGLFAALGLLVVAGGGGAAWFLRGGSSTTTAAAPPAAAVQNNGPEKVTLSFTSAPSGAKVVRPDGTELGTTPVRIQVDKGSEDIDVAFVLAGYNETRRRVTTNESKELSVNLLSKEAPAAAVPAPATPPPPTKVASSHHSSSRKSGDAPRGSGDSAIDDARLLRSSLLDDPEPKKKK